MIDPNQILIKLINIEKIINISFVLTLVAIGIIGIIVVVFISSTIIRPAAVCEKKEVAHRNTETKWPSH